MIDSSQCILINVDTFLLFLSSLCIISHAHEMLHHLLFKRLGTIVVVIIISIIIIITECTSYR